MKWQVKTKLMFYSISWQQFISILLLLTTLWYLVVFIYFHRKKTRDFPHTSCLVKKMPLEKGEELGEEPLEEPKENYGFIDLIGKPAIPEGVTEMGMKEIQFLSNEEISSPNLSFQERVNSKVDQLGLIPDVLHELKSAFYMIKMEDGTKEDLLSLFGFIKDRYTALKGLPDPQYLIDFIAENSPVDLTRVEIMQLFA